MHTEYGLWLTVPMTDSNTEFIKRDRPEGLQALVDEVIEQHKKEGLEIRGLSVRVSGRTQNVEPEDKWTAVVHTYTEHGVWTYVDEVTELYVDSLGNRWYKPPQTLDKDETHFIELFVATKERLEKWIREANEMFDEKETKKQIEQMKIAIDKTVSIKAVLAGDVYIEDFGAGFVEIPDDVQLEVTNVRMLVGDMDWGFEFAFVGVVYTPDGRVFISKRTFDNAAGF